MPASFSYGKRDGRVVHVADLAPSEHRGLQCGCACPKCGRPLVAHLGEKKAWHFQHHAEDINCNPQPMTLLHAFVRDELAARRQLVVPAVNRHMDVQVNDKLYSTLVSVAEQAFEIDLAEAEARGDGVQPDVVYTLQNGVKVALEVRYTHAVDAAKQAILRRGYAMAAEFDVSDLLASGVTRARLAELLQHSHRWRWLAGTPLTFAQARAAEGIAWSQGNWRATVQIEAVPNVHAAPTRLAQASRRMGWARVRLQELRARGVKGDAGAQWLAEQDKVDRVALACAALRLEPAHLPGFLLQRAPPDRRRLQALLHHPYSWQVLVFMKFGIGRAEFSSRKAADWCLQAMPDRCEPEDGTESRNGFTRTAARLHLYFLQLETQGWLRGIPSDTRETRTFRPKFETVEQLHVALARPEEGRGCPYT